jgi:hypothetical protein
MSDDPITYNLPADPWRRTVITPQQLQAGHAARLAKSLAESEARQEQAERRAREREQALQAEGAARLAAYEGEARRRFLNNGGSDSDFRAAWPRMKADWLIEQSAADPRERRVAEATEQLRNDPRYTF